MRVLLTNDDGIGAEGLHAARRALLGEKPDLIVSGINHGSNLGDDITYSGTVAAALEGIVLGLPAVAISQQSERREMGFNPARAFDFERAGGFLAGLVGRLGERGMPEGTLININCPAGEASGVEVTHLGKRLYDDELKLVDEDSSDGRRRYRIYGFEPSFEDEEGSDLSAIAEGRISVTPVHFDLTDRGGIEALREWDLGALGASPGGDGQ